MAKKEMLFPLTTIGGRLQAKMIEKGFTRIDLYNAIYPKTTAITDDSKKKTVYNWFSGKTALSIDDVKTLCRFLDCSSDYLLGLDECSNKSIQYIHDVTGLSEESITRLINEKEGRDTLSKMVSDKRDYKLDMIKGRYNMSEGEIADQLEMVRQNLHSLNHIPSDGIDFMLYSALSDMVSISDSVKTSLFPMTDYLIKKDFARRIVGMILRYVERKYSIKRNRDAVENIDGETVAAYFLDKESSEMMNNILQDPQIYEFFIKQEDEDFQVYQKWKEQQRQELQEFEISFD